MTQDILEENTQRTKGSDALTSNIEAAKAVAQIVKTTLGPMGMDKMLIDSTGDTIVTNDGVKILKEMEITHPGAQMLVDVAKTQEQEVGDGTTTAVVLSGELLSKAQGLLQKKIHPISIISGYNKAMQEALKILDKQATAIDLTDKDSMMKIAETAMTGKAAEHAKSHLAELLFSTIQLVQTEKGINKKSVKLVKSTGGSTEDSFLVQGIVLDKELAHVNMKHSVKDPLILLVDFPLEVRELDTSANVNLNSAEDYEAFIESERQYLASLVHRIKELGATAVFCQKGIDDSVAYYLAKEGIVAIRRCRKSDLERLALALNSKVVSNEEDLVKEHLGSAKEMSRKEFNNEGYIFVEGCNNPKSVSLFLRASTDQVVGELERAIEDALGDLSAVIRSKKIVAGGGAIELSLATELEKFAQTCSGKEQLIIQSFADSFRVIPKLLCENSGFDEIETMTSLQELHSKGNTKAGINSFNGIVNDTHKEHIVEPINVKSQAIKSATESASMILRIDDIIAAKKLERLAEEPEF